MRATQPEHQQPARSELPSSPIGARVALGLSVGGLALSVAAPLLLTGDAAGILYTVGMVMVLAAAVVWVVARMRQLGQHFTIVPTTTAGRLAGGMLVASGVLVVAFLAGSFGSDLAILVGVFVVAGAVLALVAHFRRGDRSAPLVFVSLLLAMFMIYFFAGEVAFPH